MIVVVVIVIIIIIIIVGTFCNGASTKKHGRLTSLIASDCVSTIRISRACTC